jgi:hypothetical protein
MASILLLQPSSSQKPPARLDIVRPEPENWVHLTGKLDDFSVLLRSLQKRAELGGRSALKGE